MLGAKLRFKITYLPIGNPVESLLNLLRLSSFLIGEQRSINVTDNNTYKVHE